MPLPQVAPLPLKQSAGQVLQSQPNSQVPFPQQLSINSFTQPPGSTQESAVHSFPSSQAIGPSFTQPVAGLQLSAVHARPSSQLTGVFEQEPPLHVSVVHSSLSSHSASLAQAAWPSRQDLESLKLTISGMERVG